MYVDGRAHDEVEVHLGPLEELELGAFEAPSGHRPQHSPTLQHRHAMLLYDMVWYMYGKFAGLWHWGESDQIES